MIQKEKYGSVTIKKELGSLRILAEISELAGKDAMGKEYPAYWLVHCALVHYLNHLKTNGKSEE